MTDRYRFAISDNHPAKLFDLVADGDEWNNLADDPFQAALVGELTAKVKAEWKKAKSCQQRDDANLTLQIS